MEYTPRDDLYIMRYDWNDKIVKIGHSTNIENRVKYLECGQAFRVIVLSVFPGKGHLEGKVHELLSEFRVNNCMGREWFEVSQEFATKTIKMAIALDSE